MKTKMCVTSLVSYYNILNELGKRQKEVLISLKKINHPVNNLMVSRFMNLPINQITPRMNELRKLGIVIYHHTASCPFTKHSSRFFVIKNYISESMN